MKKKRNDFFQKLIYSFKVAFFASKTFFVAKSLVTIMMTVLPLGKIYLWSIILNSIVAKNIGLYYKEIIGLYIAITILEVASNRAEEYISNRYNDLINMYLDNLLVDKVSNIDYAFFDSSLLYDKIKDSYTLVQGVQSICWQIFSVLQAFIQVLLSFILLCSLNINLAIFVLVTIIPALYSRRVTNDIVWGYERESAKLFRKLEYFKRCTGREGAFETRLYRLEKIFIKKYKDIWYEWNGKRKKVFLKSNLMSIACLVFLSMGEIAVIIISILKLSKGKIGIGDVSYYILLLSNMRDYTQQLIHSLFELKYSFCELDAVKELLNLQSELKEGEKSIKNNVPKIEFRDVSFHYPKQSKYILVKCNFTIEKGEKVGLVGLNGAGKTTIVLLLLRLYDPTEGQILINDVDIKGYKIAEIRSMFGILFQDFVKYSMSVKESICLSNIDRKCCDKEVWKICRESKIEKMILQWPEKLNTQLTNRFSSKGKELSGGQWQRIALARTLYGNKGILILDEPSSALDSIAEHEIFNSLMKRSKEKSILFISHRFSNLVDMDKIIVIENGKIIEQGNHQCLMQKDGIYAKLFRVQAERYLI